MNFVFGKKTQSGKVFILDPGTQRISTWCRFDIDNLACVYTHLPAQMSWSVHPHILSPEGTMYVLIHEIWLLTPYITKCPPSSWFEVNFNPHFRLPTTTFSDLLTTELLTKSLLIIIRCLVTSFEILSLTRS